MQCKSNLILFLFSLVFLYFYWRYWWVIQNSLIHSIIRQTWYIKQLFVTNATFTIMLQMVYSFVTHRNAFLPVQGHHHVFVRMCALAFRKMHFSLFCGTMRINRCAVCALITFSCVSWMYNCILICIVYTNLKLERYEESKMDYNVKRWNSEKMALVY